MTWRRKPQSAAARAEMPADVAGADDVEPRRGRERIDVDVHLSTADEAVLLGEIVVELVVEQRLTARVDRVARLQAGVVLVAAAADRADDAAVGKDQHLGAGALRRRAVARGRPSRARRLRRASALPPRRTGPLRSDQDLDLRLLPSWAMNCCGCLLLLLLRQSPASAVVDLARAAAVAGRLAIGRLDDVVSRTAS